MTVSRADNQTLAFSYSTSDQGRLLAIMSGRSTTYTTSSAGDAGGTTMICDTLTDASDAYAGKLIEFLDGDNQGKRAVVVAFTHGTDTLTIEDMPNQVASGVRFRILQHPMVVAVADSGTTTTCVDATKTDDDDFFIDCYLRCIYAVGSIVVGEMKRITDFTKVTGTFTTTDAFSAAVTAGDVFIVERPVLAEDLAVEHPVDMIERNPVRSTNVPEQSCVGARRGATVSFSLPVNGNNTGAGDGVTWTRSSTIMPLLEACFGVLTLDTGDTDQAGGNTTVITVSDGTRFTAGLPVMINGDVRTIASIAGNDLTLESALPDAPAATDVVYAPASVRYSSTGHYPVTFEYWQDNVRFRFWSCYGTVTFSTDAAGRLMAAFSWQAMAWDSLAESMPVSDIHEHYPDADVECIIARDTPVRLGTTEIEAGTYAVDTGLVVSARPATGGIEGSKAFLVTGCKPTFTVDPIKESDTYDDAVVNGTTYDHGAQFNAKPGNTAFFWMPKVQITANGSAESEGYYRNQIAGKSIVPGSSDPLGEGIVISFL